MIGWELEDKVINIHKDGTATEQVYYKYKDWQKWEYTDDKERRICISHSKSPFLSFIEDSERSALLKTLEEADRLRRAYNDLSEEIKELLEMEGEK